MRAPHPVLHVGYLYHLAPIFVRQSDIGDAEVNQFATVQLAKDHYVYGVAANPVMEEMTSYDRSDLIDRPRAVEGEEDRAIIQIRGEESEHQLAGLRRTTEPAI
jgi:hypothetical protein